ncbi:hypothetical protein DSO57_1021640 [Entomophthora muscae]|uniref:Uncharacterized protein n=1 Tax=Entomophthora muscae TaxID=34485 RepID=A0ACC2RUR0_9FUNG|nr:hypothetical protein DSO57_1021640 [Entomophthora muscae]
MNNTNIQEVWQVVADKVQAINIDGAPLENRILISLGMVVSGLMYCLVGRNMMRFVLFGIGAVVAGGTAYGMVLEGFKLDHTHVVQLYSASIWLMVAGLAGGSACMGLLRIGLVVVGGWLGLSLVP